MLKHSINKSNNLLNAKESVGRVEFMIGCGDKMFENGKVIAHQVNEHIKMGALDELSGLPFNWWNIWSKHVKSRSQRMKRQIDGSGNDDDYDEYGDEDDEVSDRLREGIQLMTNDSTRRISMKKKEIPKMRTSTLTSKNHLSHPLCDSESLSNFRLLADQRKQHTSATTR
jgi:neurexin